MGSPFNFLSFAYNINVPYVQAVLFSHPADFTPVCTTELGEVARRSEQFKARNVKVLGVSVSSLEHHGKWIADINSFGAKTKGPTDVQFPIVSPFSLRICFMILTVLKNTTFFR